MPNEKSRLVYSTDGTDGSRVREPSMARGRNLATAQPQQRAAPPADGVVRVQREKKGRGGKTVTIVTGLSGDEDALDGLLKLLKQHCGAGGTRDGSTIEIQGDHRERLRAKLEALGHRVKLADG